ncbi:Nephrocystin-3, partial [Rhodococcus opacus M213]
MAGRLALIIGSECGTQRRLEFTGELAMTLHHTLVTAGGWRPALGRDRPVLNPSIKKFKKSVKDAFTAANTARATLLIAFIGHGMTTASQDFHLLTRNSPADPDSDTAYHLTQGIRERLNAAPYLDGLIVLIDACEAAEAIAGAADRWVEMLGAAAGRMELLVASGEDNAFDGCFTRTLTAALDNGIERGGENLLCADVLPHVAQCPGQEPRHLAFTGGWVAHGDPGLWLVPNLARVRDAVTGRASAGLVDQLTRGVVTTDAVRERLTDLVDADSGPRLRVVVGPAGSGKSTLMSLLIRPGLVDTLDITADYIAAAVFLDATSTLESLTAELIGQLARRVSGFADARDAVGAELTDEDRLTATSFELELLRPLQRCRAAGRRIRLLVDGLDQPEAGGRDNILAGITDLTRDITPGLAHVRVIVGVRSGTGVETRTELDHAHRIELTAPTPDDLRRAMPPESLSLIEQDTSGGWLIVRLLKEIHATVKGDPGAAPLPADLSTLVHARLAAAEGQTGDPAHVRALTSLLVAAGVGPTLPLPLATTAMAVLGHGRSVTQIHDDVVKLGVLVSRGKPGLPDETLGIAHTAFLSPLVTALGDEDIVSVAAHTAILSAFGELASAGPVTPDITAYTRTAAPRHHLAAGDPVSAVRALIERDSARAGDNRDRWASWLPAFQKLAGANHPATLSARGHLASWRGEAGDVARAVTEFEALLAAQQRVQGADHPDTLRTRGRLASWHGKAGDVARAITESEALLADRKHLLGPDHPDTLRTRAHLARWRGENGDLAGAIVESEALLAAQQRVQGADHPDTLRTRAHLARWRGRNGELARA